MPVWFYLILTLILELPVVLLFFKKKWKYALLIGFLLNMLTWPSLHLLLEYTSIDINILEIGVVFTEGLGYCIYMGSKWHKGFGISFLVNGLSYGAGLLFDTYIL